MTMEDLQIGMGMLHPGLAPRLKGIHPRERMSSSFQYSRWELCMPKPYGSYGSASVVKTGGNDEEVRVAMLLEFRHWVKAQCPKAGAIAWLAAVA